MPAEFIRRVEADGIPSTWLDANAICRKPMTRPRTCIANRSVTIAKQIALITPPKYP